MATELIANVEYAESIKNFNGEKQLLDQQDNLIFIEDKETGMQKRQHKNLIHKGKGKKSVSTYVLRRSRLTQPNDRKNI